MANFSRQLALVCGVAVAVLSAITAAQQQVYRYVDKDGRVIYTDRSPPPDGKEILYSSSRASTAPWSVRTIDPSRRSSSDGENAIVGSSPRSV